MTELTKKEAKFIYNIINVVENGVLKKFGSHIESLEKMEGKSGERKKKWVDETIEEWDMMQMIKCKMAKIYDNSKKKYKVIKNE